MQTAADKNQLETGPDKKDHKLDREWYSRYWLERQKYFVKRRQYIQEQVYDLKAKQLELELQEKQIDASVNKHHQELERIQAEEEKLHHLRSCLIETGFIPSSYIKEDADRGLAES